MSGGRFLVSMKEVNNSERMLALNSIIKEGIDFREENVYTDDNNTYDVTVELRNRLDEL